MKYFFLVLGLFFLAKPSVFSQKKRTIFYGQFSTDHPNAKLNSTMKESVFESGLINTYNDSNSKNSFKYVLNMDRPKYYSIGRNSIYLSPGDSINATINFEDPFLSIFSGKNAQINDYLKSTPLPKGGSFLHSGDSVKNSIEASIVNIFQCAYQRKAFLAAQEGLPLNFKIFEEHRIECDIYNSLFYLNGYYPYINKLSDSSKLVFSENYKILTDPLLNSLSVKIVDPKLLDLSVYRNIIYDIIQRNKNIKQQPDISNYLLASEYIYRMNSTSNYEELIKMKDSIALFRKSDYRELLKNSVNSKLTFINGDVAFSFPLTDTIGSIKELKTLKGKIIYIDIWATWCKPCLEEFIFLDSLRIKFSNKSDIIFMSVSVDDNPQIWKSFLKGKKLKGEQFYSDRDKLIAYDVNALPRAILIGKDFKVIEINAPLPSSKTIEALLSDLLQE